MTIPISTRLFPGEVPSFDVLSQRLRQELNGSEVERSVRLHENSDGIDLVNFMNFGHPGPFTIHDLDVKWQGDTVSVQYMAPLKTVTVRWIQGGMNAFQTIDRVLEEMGGTLPKPDLPPEFKKNRARKIAMSVALQTIFMAVLALVFWRFGIAWGLLTLLIWMVAAMAFRIAAGLAAAPARLKVARAALARWYAQNGQENPPAQN